MGHNGAERAVRFGWPAIADQILAVVREESRALAA
jgi:hypothetical protein